VGVVGASPSLFDVHRRDILGYPLTQRSGDDDQQLHHDRHCGGEAH
jgi:hypothetical protein